MAKDKPKQRTYHTGDVHKRRAEKTVHPQAHADQKDSVAIKQSVKKGQPHPRSRKKVSLPPKASLNPSQNALPKVSSQVSNATESVRNEQLDSTEKKLENNGESKSKKNPRKLWVRLVVGIVLLVALVATAGVLAWNRWMRYNDMADMQGIWYAYGTEVPVTFTEDSIIFNENTVYTYGVDSEAKTLTYSIGDLNGQGRYWFSDNRSLFIITDGYGYTKWNTMFEDVLHSVDVFFSGESLPISEKSIVFSRVPGDESVGEFVPNNALKESDSNEQTKPEDEAMDKPTTEEKPSESSDEQKDEKTELSQVPISDIVQKDDTPIWDESNEQSE